jgi:glycosyltransferase involved in cell wall biosynthesis
MTRMRVLMTADTTGGVWTYAYELVRALAPLDVDVTIATMGAPPSLAQIAAISALPNAELVASSFEDAAGDWLLELACRTDPEIVHLNSYAHAALPFRVPTVVVAHSDAPADRRRAGLAAAAAIVAPTRAILTALGASSKGRVIPHGRDSATWRPAAKEPFIFSAGRLWDAAHGLPELDACASRIDWPIHVAGPTVTPDDARVEPRGVRLLGELRPDALADWMARASIYALPARYEPHGLAVHEAALSGSALLLGRIETLEEVWGEAAAYTPPGDADALAFELEALAADHTRRRALAAAARARALALTPARMAAAYRELYRELTEEVA